MLRGRKEDEDRSGREERDVAGAGMTDILVTSALCRHPHRDHTSR